MFGCVCSWLCKLSSAIGALVICYWLYLFVQFVLRHFSKPSDAFLKKVKSDGAWAVVTGASDGIGKAYAATLAKKGFNVFLISRTASKLEEVAKELAASGVQTKIKAVDFVTAGDEVFHEIEDEVRSLSNVAILVNNVGINYSYPQHFLESTSEVDENIVNVNINVTNKMTRIVLPLMVEKKKGAIVNLSSMAGRVPTPMLAVYSGTKAYVDFFSKCLAQEYKGQGIVVQSVTPGMVVSNMSKVRKTSTLVASPEHIASRSLGKLGDQVELSPFYTHGVLNHVFKMLPDQMVSKYLHNMNKGIQKRALRKR